MLFREHFLGFELFALGQSRQPAVFAVRIVFVAIARVLRFAYVVDRQPTRGLEHRTVGPERVTPRFDVDARHVEDGGGHLRCDEAVPDQGVQPELVAAEVRLDLFRRELGGGRPDGLVRLLRLFRHLVGARLRR